MFQFVVYMFEYKRICSSIFAPAVSVGALLSSVYDLLSLMH